MKFFILKIVNDSTFVISNTDVENNEDYSEYFKVGQKFTLIGKEKNIIHDPDSGEEIGSIDDIKGVAFIDSILESSTILKTKLHNRTNVDLAKSFSTILESATKQSTYREKLNVDESMVTSLQSETPLKVGDYAITTID